MGMTWPSLLWAAFFLLISYASGYLPIWMPVVSRIQALAERQRFMAALGLLGGMLAVETIASFALAWVAAVSVMKVIGL